MAIYPRTRPITFKAIRPSMGSANLRRHPMKRLFIAAGLLFLSGTPSFAQDMTTLQYMLSNGVVILGSLAGQPIEMRVTYKDDGTSTTMIVGQGGKGAELAGKWRSDGDKICTTNAMNPLEICYVVPPGKKPGDAFKVETPAMGEVTITINK
jgi:hypothetical protein